MTSNSPGRHSMRVKNFFAPTSRTCGECMPTEPLRCADSTRAVREVAVFVPSLPALLLAHFVASLLSKPHDALIIPADVV